MPEIKSLSEAEPADDHKDELHAMESPDGGVSPDDEHGAAASLRRELFEQPDIPYLPCFLRYLNEDIDEGDPKTTTRVALAHLRVSHAKQGLAGMDLVDVLRSRGDSRADAEILADVQAAVDGQPNDLGCECLQWTGSEENGRCGPIQTALCPVWQATRSTTEHGEKATRVLDRLLDSTSETAISDVAASGAPEPLRLALEVVSCIWDDSTRQRLIDRLLHRLGNLVDAGSVRAKVTELARERLWRATRTAAPGPGGTIIPPGFRVIGGALYALEQDRRKDKPDVLVRRVAEAVPLLTRRMTVVPGDEVWLTFAFQGPDGAKHEITERKAVWTTISGLQRQLSGTPLAIEPGNARELASWLFKHWWWTSKAMPSRQAVRQLGWDSSRRWFVLGDRTFGPAGGPFFMPGGSGDAALRDALRERGSFEEWDKMARELVAEHPLAGVILAASAASIILPLLDLAGGLIVQLVGGTTTGKTTAVLFGLSLFGDPFALVRGSSNTANYIGEYMATVGNGVPFALDDAHLLPRDRRHQGNLGEVLQFAANGVGKGRAEISMDRVTSGYVPRWSGTTLLTCNEDVVDAPSVDARVITIADLPFGTGNKKTEADRIRAVIRRSHGHVAPRILEHLTLNGGEQARSYQELFAGLQGVLKCRLPRGSNPFYRRLDGVAAITVGACALYDVLGWSFEGPDIGDVRNVVDNYLFKWSTAEHDRDPPFEDLARFLDRIWASQSNLVVVGGSEVGAIPQSGTADTWGFWDPVRGRLSLKADVTEQAARDLGIDLAERLAQWRDRGWLLVERGRLKYPLPGSLLGRGYVIKVPPQLQGSCGRVPAIAG